MRSTVIGLALAAGSLGGLAACEPTESSPSGTPAADASDGLGPTATLASALATFEARLRDATARHGLLVRSLAEASGSGRAADLRLAVGQVRTWVDGERVWIRAHPTEPCFELAVATFDEALDAMDASADSFLGMVEATTAPSDDVTRPSIGAAAVQSLQDASRALLDAAAQAKNARPNCP
jgi:hypothetical protein